MTWDYIVVGAGTAGSVVAHQLSESGSRRVLLVEAGGWPNLAVKIPGAFPKLFKTPLDWAFQSEPQAGCDGRVVFTPRGRMLGGSANMNAQIHQWCHPADFDGWEQLGASGWGWRDVAPVFRQMESWNGEETAGAPRGRSGPMLVSHLRSPSPMAQAFVAAARAAGVHGTDDYNGLAYDGAWLVQLAHKNGARYSAYDAYLKPAMQRKNLEVRTGRQVAKIVFEGRRATGIALGESHAEPVLRATEGVVLCAGAFGSPQLLMLSGVGPADALRSLGIPLVLDAPGVGANLQDHPIAPLTWGTHRPLSHKSAQGVGQLLRWLLFRRGILASNVTEAMAISRAVDREVPDSELLFGNVEWRDQGLAVPQVHGYTIAAAVVAPRSRGRLWLTSPAACDPPRIDFGLLTDADGVDAQVILAGARLARRIAATEPLRSETAAELAPGADVTSDDELLSYLKSQMQTVYHPSGTCRMGSDGGAPVDPRLRARGLDGLWVADASVMPTVPRGHPNAVVAMIAQRASTMINSL